MQEINKRPYAGFGVMLMQDKKILLGKRHHDPVKASSDLHGEGTWTMPGGKLDFQETFENGAYREVLEETGIKINKNHLELISVTNDIVSDAHYVTLGFLCKEFKGEPKLMEPEEITEWQWFTLKKLPIPIYPPSYQIIRHFLDKNIYNVLK